MRTELGQKQGATLLSGGHRVGNKGYFVEPTVFDNVKDDMAIAKDEIFGPVVSVLPFTSAEEAAERANKTTGLAAAVWTKNIDKAHLFAKQVKAGTVWVNCYHVVDTTTPFGGFKMSGQGRKKGEAALEHYTKPSGDGQTGVIRESRRAGAYAHGSPHQLYLFFFSSGFSGRLVPAVGRLRRGSAASCTATDPATPPPAAPAPGRTGSSPPSPFPPSSTTPYTRP